MQKEFERAYRDAMDGVRLTAESKRALTESLGKRVLERPRPPLKLGRAAAAAAALCLLTAAGGAAVMNATPVLRDRFFGGDSVGYGQSGGFVGKAVENNGWTLSITDCVGDDYYLYLGLELEAPEGTVLDAADYDFERSRVDFTDSSLYGSWAIRPLPDDDPTDNRLPMMWLLYSSQPGVNGATVRLAVSGLGHNWRYEAGRREQVYDADCPGTWDFGYVTVRCPDSIIRLEPDTPVNAILPGPGADRAAVVSEIQISPLALYVRLSGEELVLHHGTLRPQAGDAVPGACWDAQELAAYDTDGNPIEMSPGMEIGRWANQNISRSRRLGGGGCSGYNETDGYIWLVYGFNGLMDVSRVAEVVVNGTAIPIP